MTASSSAKVNNYFDVREDKTGLRQVFVSLVSLVLSPFQTIYLEFEILWFTLPMFIISYDVPHVISRTRSYRFSAYNIEKLGTRLHVHVLFSLSLSLQQSYHQQKNKLSRMLVCT